MLSVIYKPATLWRMAQSREHKAQTREHILAHASAQLRTNGVGGVSIAQIMSAIGLTHGGFYRHFKSREDLIAQACARALTDGATAGARARAGQAPCVSAYVKSYLSRKHRDTPGEGCALAALAADLPRAGPATSAVFTNGLKETLDRLQAQCASASNPDVNVSNPGASAGSNLSDVADQQARQQAVVLMSTLLGALVLARAVDDAALSDFILSASRSHLLDGVNPSKKGAT